MQSEVEGAENESVGFYGRCVLHATHPLCESGSDPFDIEVVCTIEKEFTCARTEVLVQCLILWFPLYSRVWGGD